MSRCWAIGRDIVEARTAKSNVVERVCKESGARLILPAGKVVDRFDQCMDEGALLARQSAFA